MRRSSPASRPRPSGSTQRALTPARRWRAPTYTTLVSSPAPRVTRETPRPLDTARSVRDAGPGRLGSGVGCSEMFQPVVLDRSGPQSRLPDPGRAVLLPAVSGGLRDWKRQNRASLSCAFDATRSTRSGLIVGNLQWASSCGRHRSDETEVSGGVGSPSCLANSNFLSDHNILATLVELS